MSTYWRDCCLGELLRIKHGFAFKGEYFSDSGDFVLLTPGNFQPDGGLKLKGEKERYYDGAFPPDFLLEPGDMLVAMTDLTQEARILGSPAVIPGGAQFLHNQRLGKVVIANPEILDRLFLYHLFNDYRVREQIKASATGATVRHTAPDRIYTVKVRLPSFPDQRRIASILSAYDDLIENNARRIAILEEMARRIYEEWFVRFRFPGHEGVRMVESELGLAPATWRACLLGDETELAYGKALKAEDREAGLVPVYGSSGVVGTHSKSLVAGPGVIVGRKGNVGSVHWCEEPFFPIDTVFYVKTGLPLHFAYFNLQRQNFLNNDAAVPGLNRNQAYALPLLVPDRILLVKFEDLCGQVLGLARLLGRKNTNLRTTRDLLLPKLISGELDVSDLPEPQAAAA